MSDTSGFLTQTDRRFLRGEKKYTGEHAKQNRYQRRKAIAERTRKAFADFALLHAELDRHERNRIFDVGPHELGPAPQAVLSAVGEEGGYSPTAEEIQDYIDQKEERAILREHVTDTIAFLYHTLEGEPGEAIPDDRGFPYDFETVLKAAIHDAERDRRGADVPFSHIHVTFDVDVVVPDIDYQYAIEKFARGESHELSDRELRGLLTALTSDLVPLDAFAQFDDLHEFADRVEERREQLREERGEREEREE